MDEKNNNVSVRKPKENNEIAKMFIKNDARTVADNIVYDHILPGFMDMVIDGLHSTIDMFLGSGRSRKYSRSYGEYTEPRTSYHRYYKEKDYRYDRRNREEETRRRSRGRYRIDEISFEERSKAREVLDDMIGEIHDYGEVSVDQYYRFALGKDYEGGDWATDHWGWDNLRDVSVLQLRGNGRWVIDLPDPIKI